MTKSEALQCAMARADREDRKIEVWYDVKTNSYITTHEGYVPAFFLTRYQKLAVVDSEDILEEYP